MSNELTATITQTAVATFDLSPKSLDQAMELAKFMSDSDLVPKDFKGKPGNCLIAIQWGLEIGLKPMQAMQNIAVINGRPALWGDALIALVRSSPICEYVVEEDDGAVAYCRVKRRGEPEQVRTFSVEDARIAGLVGKGGPWTQYPARMRQMRARAFALRDVFPDVLKGIPVAEEIMDIPREVDITPQRNATPTQLAQAQAAAAPELNEHQKQLIVDLEEVARMKGLKLLGEVWATLTKEDRKAIGEEELKRLKNIAQNADDDRAIAAQEAQREAQAAGGEQGAQQ